MKQDKDEIKKKEKEITFMKNKTIKTLGAASMAAVVFCGAYGAGKVHAQEPEDQNPAQVTEDPGAQQQEAGKVTVTSSGIDNANGASAYMKVSGITYSGEMFNRTVSFSSDGTEAVDLPENLDLQSTSVSLGYVRDGIEHEVISAASIGSGNISANMNFAQDGLGDFSIYANGGQVASGQVNVKSEDAGEEQNPANPNENSDPNTFTAKAADGTTQPQAGAVKTTPEEAEKAAANNKKGAVKTTAEEAAKAAAANKKGAVKTTAEEKAKVDANKKADNTKSANKTTAAKTATDNNILLFSGIFAAAAAGIGALAFGLRKKVRN